MFEGVKRSIGKLLDSVVKTELKGEELNSLLWDFKLSLLENDVALSVVDQICEDVKRKLEGGEVKRFEDRRKIIEKTLREIIYNVLNTEKKTDIISQVEKKRQSKEPAIIVFIGINGVGKTTTIGKVAHLLIRKGYSVVLAGSDTHRSGSIEQLEGHAKHLGIRVIKHAYGADAAAVAFDAISHAKAHGINAVLIDTAGRMQTNKNLMEEMKKIIKVTQPDLVVFIGDSLAGNDAVEQAQNFCKYVDFDASILTKADADARGGAAISIAYVTKKPTIFLGTGQTYDDLTPFESQFLIEKIFT
ncbi:MAG: signal recognition particle-docking protein FtsY [Candidatus Bathyarchaeota archaeon]